MKKVISFLVSITILSSFAPVFAADNISDIDYPNEGAELGYLFSLKSEPDAYFDVNDYEGIETASEMANIYFSDTIEHIKAIENIVDIDMIVENWALDVPEPEDDINSVSLFADTELDDTNIYDEPYLNDPLFEQQWHYTAIKASAFRDNGIDGNGVKVGIIDTGLTKEFKTFYDFEGVDIQTGINICAKLDKNEELLYDTSDNQTHGTAVASVICAKTNNEYGIAGLADACTVIPYKVDDYRCSAFANTGYAIIVAVEEAYDDNCDVVNISQTIKEAPQNQLELINSIYEKAVSNGMIIVVGSGNEGQTTNLFNSLAISDNVIGVGNIRPNCDPEPVILDAETRVLKSENEATVNDKFTDRYIQNTIKDLAENDYVKSETSTANESVFISAPGRHILTADCSQNIKTSFESSNGTSFATPIVAAAAIGVKQMRPYVDVDMFKEILKATAVDLEEPGYDINTGYGMVNFERIYDYVSQMPESIPKTKPSVTIDYENKTLTGFKDKENYTINGENITLDDTLSLPIREEWFGATIEIVTKSTSDAYTDSEPQTLVIPSCSAPTGLVGETNAISGTTSDMQYRKVGANAWSNAKDGTTSCSVGVYEVRYKLSDSSFASEIAIVQVGLAIPNVAIDYRYERLKSFERGESYTINGEDITLNTVYCPLKEEWFGTTIEIIRKASDKYMNESEPQLLEIPARPKAPNVILFTDNTVNLTSDVLYKEESADYWSKGKNDITLEQGKTYSFRVQYTSNSFASEIRQITVQLDETPQYDIETSIAYENGICTYTAVNNTIWSATGVIAVYADGVLKHLETTDIAADGANGTLNCELLSGDNVKFFVWNSLQSMKPIDNVKLSEHFIK